MATATQNQTNDSASTSTATVDVKATTTEATAKDNAKAPAEANAEADTKDDAEAPTEAPAKPPADQPKDKADPKPADAKAERKQSEATRKANGHKLEACLDEHGQVREDTDAYADLGFVYAATAPVANSWGAELGVVTKDKENGTVQRTGFGFYFRSDHLCNKKYDGKVELP